MDAIRLEIVTIEQLSSHIARLNIDELLLLRIDAEKLRHDAQTSRLPLCRQNRTVEYKLRIERALGTRLSELDLKKKRADQAAECVTLASLGVSQNDSTRWQALASVPEAVFREYVAACCREGLRLTTRAVLDLAAELKTTGRRRVKRHRIDKSTPIHQGGHANAVDPSLVEDLIGHAETLQTLLGPLRESMLLSTIEQRTVRRFAAELVAGLRKLQSAITPPNPDV